MNKVIRKTFDATFPEPPSHKRKVNMHDITRIIKRVKWLKGESQSKMGPLGLSTQLERKKTKSDDAFVRPTSLEVMFSRSWNVMMLRNLALIRHSVLSRSVGLCTMSRRKSVMASKKK